jgi:hypothetical protein
MTPPQTGTTYRDELARLAGALVGGNLVELAPSLADGSLVEHVAMFAQGNLGKRSDKLKKRMKVLREAVPETDDWIAAYLASSTIETCNMYAADACGFLCWLKENAPLTAEQLDEVVCQHARLEVEQVAARNRGGHVYFQELWSVKDELAGEFGTAAGVRIHLNPVRVQVRLHTPALLEGVTPPADVLFFAVRDGVATAVLDPLGLDLLRELAALSPCTLELWAAVSVLADRDSLEQLCRDLVDMGLAAFA